MADRIGVINQGGLVLVEGKTELMKKLGKRQLILHLKEPLSAIPAGLAAWRLTLADGGAKLVYTVDGSSGGGMDVSPLLKRMSDSGISIKDLQTHQSSLEDIFVGLVSNRPGAQP